MAALNKLNEYGKVFQLKVLKVLLKDRGFLLDIRDVLTKDFFDSEAHKWLVDSIIDYFDKYNTTSTLEALSINAKKVENEILRVSIKEELKSIFNLVIDDEDYVKEEFSAFAKNQKLKNALMGSVDLLQLGDYDGIRTKIEDALKAGNSKDIGHNYKKDVETRYREDYRPTIPTPWKSVNDNIQGGFGPGDLVTVFGNPGGGKSWMMIAMAGHAAKMGYNVVYYTLELSEDYVGKRFDCYFSGKSMEYVNNNREHVQSIVDNLKGGVIVKEYSPRTATITNLKSHLDRCKNEDFEPDMIIIDYIDYLRSRTRSTENKDAVDDLYIASKGLGKEYNVPVVSPSQVNRAGAKDDVIEGDKAAGSYDKIMVSDIAFSLARKKEDKIEGTGRFHYIKNRYGDDGMTYDILVDTEIGNFEMEDDSGPYMTEEPKQTSVNGVDTSDRKSLAENYFESRISN